MSYKYIANGSQKSKPTFICLLGKSVSVLANDRRPFKSVSIGGRISSDALFVVPPSLFLNSSNGKYSALINPHNAKRQSGVAEKPHRFGSTVETFFKLSDCKSD